MNFIYTTNNRLVRERFRDHFLKRGIALQDVIARIRPYHSPEQQQQCIKCFTCDKDECDPPCKEHMENVMLMCEAYDISIESITRV